MSGDSVIRSRSNPLIRRARDAAIGKERGTLVLEGDRLVDDAIAARHEIEVVLVAHDRSERAHALSKRCPRVQVVDAEVLAAISALDSGPGVLALAPVPRSLDLSRMSVDANTLVLVAAGVADPGNLGALARAGEAFGASALVAIAGGASPWSPKALRGSMGSLLRLPVAHGLDADACALLLERNHVRSVVARTRGGVDPAEFDWKGPLALWVGAETGSMPPVTERFDAVTIPIRSGVESLNVTVAASILLYTTGRVARTR